MVWRLSRRLRLRLEAMAVSLLDVAQERLHAPPALGRAAQLLFAVALFALQVLLSQLWLRRFQYGPVEWLWRGFTYLQLPPLRR